MVAELIPKFFMDGTVYFLKSALDFLSIAADKASAKVIQHIF